MLSILLILSLCPCPAAAQEAAAEKNPVAAEESVFTGTCAIVCANDKTRWEWPKLPRSRDISEQG